MARTLLGATGAAAAVGAVAFPVLAASGSQEQVVGTNWTSQGDDVVCLVDCGSVSWSHKLETGCSKVADARLRYVRDFRPDETHAEDLGFTGCTVRAYTHGVEGGNPHHQDGKVSSGSARMAFGYKST